jgi:hypothetical protein
MGQIFMAKSLKSIRKGATLPSLEKKISSLDLVMYSAATYGMPYGRAK